MLPNIQNNAHKPLLISPANPPLNERRHTAIQLLETTIQHRTLLNPEVNQELNKLLTIYDNLINKPELLDHLISQTKKHHQRISRAENLWFLLVLIYYSMMLFCHFAAGINLMDDISEDNYTNSEKFNSKTLCYHVLKPLNDYLLFAIGLTVFFIGYQDYTKFNFKLADQGFDQEDKKLIQKIFNICKLSQEDCRHTFPKRFCNDLIKPLDPEFAYTWEINEQNHHQHLSLNL